jgi:hypothetical protein
MSSARDGAYLAHIADTVTEIGKQVEEQRIVQGNILAVLNALLETNKAQSEMLAEILGAASQDTGPSPVADALNALVSMVERMDENQIALITGVTELPEAIGRQFEACLQERPVMADTKR